jgi:hypothetical protein
MVRDAGCGVYVVRLGFGGMELGFGVRSFRQRLG